MTHIERHPKTPEEWHRAEFEIWTEPPLDPKPWEASSREKMVAERVVLMQTRAFLISQLHSVEQRIGDLNLGIAESFGSIKV